MKIETIEAICVCLFVFAVCVVLYAKERADQPRVGQKWQSYETGNLVKVVTVNCLTNTVVIKHTTGFEVGNIEEVGKAWFLRSHRLLG